MFEINIFFPLSLSVSVGKGKRSLEMQGKVDAATALFVFQEYLQSMAELKTNIIYIF